MKKILLALAAVLILAGGTVAAMKWMAIGPFAEPENAEKKEEPKEEPVESIFVDMDPIMLPVLQGDRIAGLIQIQVKLETVGQDNAIYLKRNLTKVQDTFVRDLHGFMPRLLKKKERIDVLILKDRLKVIGDRLLGKGMIRDVLVQSVIETPAR
ncbi:MAG: hypothetical protein OXR84_04985 [Magnetovibrio sp.]|nr:hypothetical protein [Magnetovibrio sp.]